MKKVAKKPAKKVVKKPVKKVVKKVVKNTLITEMVEQKKVNLINNQGKNEPFKFK